MKHTPLKKQLTLALTILAMSLLSTSSPKLNAASEITSPTTETRDTMTIIRDIQYSETAGEKGYGDLFIPKDVSHPRTVLLIHGGAWKAMTRQRVQKVAEFMARQGYAVFNVSYRLIPQAAYPAGEDDCIAAAKFLLEAGHPTMQAFDRSSIVIGGLSAGGHLALVAGLKLPIEQVAGIIDISGPTELHAPELEGLIKFAEFATGDPKQQDILKAASPTLIAQKKDELPPLLVLHCQQDGVVDIQQAYRIIDTWNHAGANLQAFLYEGKKSSGHNIWRNAASEPDLHHKLEDQITTFLQTFCAPNESE